MKVTQHAIFLSMHSMFEDIGKVAKNNRAESDSKLFSHNQCETSKLGPQKK
jgi:hypothetical protein